MRCIFGHVRALSRDLLYSNHSLSNFSGVAFLFLHSLGRIQPEPSRATPLCRPLLRELLHRCHVIQPAEGGPTPDLRPRRELGTLRAIRAGNGDAAGLRDARA